MKAGYSKPLYEYLERVGALQSNNPAFLIQAKKEYRKLYKAAWKKEHRKMIKEYAIQLKSQEHTLIKQEAKRHQLSVTGFIRTATINYCNKTYITPNYAEVMKILQLLALTYNTIIELGEDNRIASELETVLSNEIARLEKDIRINLISAKTIEQIIFSCIQQLPNKKVELLTFIQNIAVE